MAELWQAHRSRVLHPVPLVLDTPMEDFLPMDSESSSAHTAPTTNIHCMKCLYIFCQPENPQNSRSNSWVNASLSNLPLLRNVLFLSFVLLLFLNYSFTLRFLDQAIFHLFVCIFLTSIRQQTVSHSFLILPWGFYGTWHLKHAQYSFPFLPKRMRKTWINYKRSILFFKKMTRNK